MLPHGTTAFAGSHRRSIVLSNQHFGLNCDECISQGGGGSVSTLGCISLCSSLKFGFIILQTTAVMEYGLMPIEDFFNVFGLPSAGKQYLMASSLSS